MLDQFQVVAVEVVVGFEVDIDAPHKDSVGYHRDSAVRHRDFAVVDYHKYFAADNPPVVDSLHLVGILDSLLADSHPTKENSREFYFWTFYISGTYQKFMNISNNGVNWD